jgi:hypothetical protein
MDEASATISRFVSGVREEDRRGRLNSLEAVALTMVWVADSAGKMAN